MRVISRTPDTEPNQLLRDGFVAPHNLNLVNKDAKLVHGNRQALPECVHHFGEWGDVLGSAKHKGMFDAELVHLDAMCLSTSPLGLRTISRTLCLIPTDCMLIVNVATHSRKGSVSDLGIGLLLLLRQECRKQRGSFPDPSWGNEVITFGYKGKSRRHPMRSFVFYRQAENIPVNICPILKVPAGVTLFPSLDLQRCRTLDWD